ncbi:hypothetical protein ACO0K7_05300 [Undibacterium sp. Ji67W]|uniref:hypothetical protein n=1 Tax=Undibacterium sp. Ji67W TaxID=3413042 RepID=UPI003BEFA2F4
MMAVPGRKKTALGMAGNNYLRLCFCDANVDSLCIGGQFQAIFPGVMAFASLLVSTDFTRKKSGKFGVISVKFQ